MKMSAFKILLSSAAIGLTVVGCSTGQLAFAPAKPAGVSKDAAQFASAARTELQKGNPEAALAQAEKAAEASPRDLGYRMLLADLYLKNGRFVSAEAAFRDVLQLSPDNGRATFSLALAEIATGKSQSALMRLDRLAETAPAADLGLAYALAGQPDRAVTMLEGAARQEGATARVRQNLALAYAMSGDWQRARITAAQDLSPADLPQRMAEWASFVQPASSAQQVASVFGVEVKKDPGQPVQLALAPAQDDSVALASAEPFVTKPEPVIQAETAPVEVASYTPAPVYEPLPAPAPVPSAPAASKPRAAQGRFVVQLAAYGSSKAVQQGWSQLSRRYALHGTPHSAVASLPGKGKVHRLSVGYGTQNEAVRACSTIRSKGGSCFVRTNAGDRPLYG